MLSAQEIDLSTSNIVAKYTQALDAIVTSQSVLYEDTFGALAQAEAQAVIHSSQVTLPALTHDDASAREMSSKSKQVLRDMFARAYARADLYKVLEAAYAARETSVGGEPLRFMQRTLLAFEQNGVGSESAVQYSQLNEECGKNAARFEQNINENCSAILLTREELEGCQDALLESLPRVTEHGVEMFEVSMKAPVRIPVLEYASNANTRLRVTAVANSRCQTENGPLLTEILELRMGKSKLLCYNTHADYMLKQKMVGHYEGAKAFLADIHSKLKPLRARENEILKQIKREEQAAESTSSSEINEIQLHSWDISYYSRIAMERMEIDGEKIREFFPLEHVKSATFAVYQDLLGIKFEKLSGGDGKGGDARCTPVWHDEVELYEVCDVATKEVCGHIFLDLFSRDGKFGHQCVVPLLPSCHVEGGDVVHPACAILGNMTKPTERRPSLLRFAEVHTFFHEFGHAMHAVLAKSTFTRFSWTWPMMPWPGGVEQDFLEVPSMFLEKLVYQPDVLIRLSSHFESQLPLDLETIQRLNHAKHFLAGSKWSRFIGMALFDLEIHNQSPPYEYNGKEGLSLDQLFEVMMLDLADQDHIDGTSYSASWYHLVIGYDAGYYGYLYSEVFAHAILEGILEQKKERESKQGGSGFANLGVKYRRDILEPCATVDGLDMLRQFLGKEPTNEAFLKALGLE